MVVPADVAARLIAVPGVAAVVLGGSCARGTATPDSDVDLGLY
jgi:predicted nucleotidyltransferase